MMNHFSPWTHRKQCSILNCYIIISKLYHKLSSESDKARLVGRFYIFADWGFNKSKKKWKNVEYLKCLPIKILFIEFFM